jgi:hypothetical protein
MGTSNKFDQRQQREFRDSTRPNPQVLRCVFGYIAEIHDKTYQVKVRDRNGDLLGRDPDIGDWFPLMNPLEDVMLRWGELRKELIVRIWFSGEGDPANGIVEIVSDESNDFLKKVPANQGGVSVAKILSPKFPC